MRPDYQALLQRAIRDAREDPGHARRLVYELARLHLRRELWTEFRQIGRQGMHDELMALETAIAHIETTAALDEEFGPGGEVPLLESPAGEAAGEVLRPRPGDRAPLLIEAGDATRVTAAEPADPISGVRDRRVWAAIAAIIVVVAGIGTAVLYSPGFFWFGGARHMVANLHAPVAGAAPPQPEVPAAAAPLAAAPVPVRPPTRPVLPFPFPDSYGVYVVSNGQLTALEPLPLRVPDVRVSISGTITKPAPAPVPNGKLVFVVYHRDLTTSVPDKASVRVIAQVLREMTFAAGGKATIRPVGDTWAVRGTAIDFRVAPVRENPEIVVIRPADPEAVLSPGRYALVFKSQAYDFRVAGKISDTTHCLERTEAQNGTIYSECRELPRTP